MWSRNSCGCDDAPIVMRDSMHAHRSCPDLEPGDPRLDPQEFGLWGAAPVTMPFPLYSLQLFVATSLRLG